MQEKDTYIEPFEPLWVRSKYSLMGPQVATADIHNLHYQAARHGYNYLAISDPNIYGLAESVDAAQEYNLKHIIAATIPFQASAIHLQTINLIAKNNSGVRQVFGAINEAHHQGVVSPEYLYPVLESGDTFGLFEWQETHIFHRDFLKLSHAFLAFTYPSPSAKAAAHQLIKRYPHNLIITHDVRMATPTEAPLLQFLSAAYPEKATDLHRQQLLNYILPSPLAVNALYARFPKGLVAKTKEITQEIDTTVSLPRGIKAKLADQWQGDTRAYLIDRIKKNLEERFDEPVTSKRLLTELALATQFEFLDDLAIFTQIVDYCDAHNIPYEVSGSGSHSMLVYALGISHDDPIDLPMEAFLNINRTDLPDLDLLVPADRVEEVQRFLMDLYSEDAIKMSILSTFDRPGIVQLAKRRHIPVTEELINDLITAQLPHPSVTTHHSGILMAKQWTPVYTGKEPLAQFTAKSVEKFWLHKFDILPSLGLEKIQWALQQLPRPQSPNILSNDPEAFAWLFDPLSFKVGIGFLSPHLQRLLNRLRQKVPELTFNHLAEILALARPAAAASRQPYFEEQETAIVFKDQYKQLLQKLEAENLPPAVREILQQLVNSFQGYSFWQGHARTLARIIGKEAFLAKHYPVYFYSGVLKTVLTHPSGLSYHPQAYLNETIRRTGPLNFLPVHQLPPYPIVLHQQVSLSKQLLRWRSQSKRYALDYYNQELLHKDKYSPAELIEYELQHFGLAFSGNPIDRFPPHYHYQLDTPKQTIIGLPIASRVIRSKRGDKIMLLTIDSGGIFHASVAYDQAKSKLTPIDQYGYLQLSLQKTGPGWDDWQVI